MTHLRPFVACLVTACLVSCFSAPVWGMPEPLATAAAGEPSPTHPKSIKLAFRHVVKDTSHGLSLRYGLNVRVGMVKEGDLPHYKAVFQNPACMATYMNGVPRSDDEVEHKRYGHNLKRAQEGSPWVSYFVSFQHVDSKDADLWNLAGHIMVEPSDRKAAELELSYAFLPEHQGIGLASASVRELIRHLETIAPLNPIPRSHVPKEVPLGPLEETQESFVPKSIYATALITNERSCHLLKDAGFTLEDTTVEKFGGERNTYRLDFNQPS